nr:hypothetical protein CFP56_25265 [Quercus suber]
MSSSLREKNLNPEEDGLLGLGGQFFTINKRRRILHSSRMQSASEICHSTLASIELEWGLNMLLLLSSRAWTFTTRLDLITALD